MARKKKEVKYCTYCGSKNDAAVSECKKCKKSFDKKESSLKMYLEEHLPEKVTEEATSRLLDLAMAYIKTHMWGVLSIATIIFTAASVVINVLANSNDVMVVDSKPTFIAKEVLVCPDGYKLENEKCIKIVSQEEVGSTMAEVVEPQKVNRCTNLTGVAQVYSCTSGYTLEGTECVKRTSSTPTGSKYCPEGYNESSFLPNCIKSAYFTEEGPDCSHERTELLKQGIDTADGAALYTLDVTLDETAKMCTSKICFNPDYSTSPPSCSSIKEFTYPQRYSFTCEEGAISYQDNWCYFETPYINNYTCPSGTILKNDLCVAEEKKKATYGCPAGYKLDKECNICIKN